MRRMLVSFLGSHFALALPKARLSSQEYFLNLLLLVLDVPGLEMNNPPKDWLCFLEAGTKFRGGCGVSLGYFIDIIQVAASWISLRLETLSSLNLSNSSPLSSAEFKPCTKLLTANLFDVSQRHSNTKWLNVVIYCNSGSCCFKFSSFKRFSMEESWPGKFVRISSNNTYTEH